jgi:hypothetical protein
VDVWCLLLRHFTCHLAVYVFFIIYLSYCIVIFIKVLIRFPCCFSLRGFSFVPSIVFFYMFTLDTIWRDVYLFMFCLSFIFHQLKYSNSSVVYDILFRFFSCFFRFHIVVCSKLITLLFLWRFWMFCLLLFLFFVWVLRLLCFSYFYVYFWSNSFFMFYFVQFFSCSFPFALFFVLNFIFRFMFVISFLLFYSISCVACLAYPLIVVFFFPTYKSSTSLLFPLSIW